MNNPTRDDLKHAISHAVAVLTEEIEAKQHREISELKFEIQRLIDENLRVPGIVEKVSTTAPFKRLPEWVTWIHGDYSRRVRNIEVGLVDHITMLRDDLGRIEESLLEQVAQERESVMEVVGLDLSDQVAAMENKMQELFSLSDQKHRKDIEITGTMMHAI